jgi:hypothetical protein
MEEKGRGRARGRKRQRRRRSEKSPDKWAVNRVNPPLLLLACRKKRVKILAAQSVSVNGEALQVAAWPRDAV